MKKQTPYAMQFFNFGEFETLIRVFVIKDIWGSVYCTLGHSINYDTLEGKIMLLYIEKEAGETPNSDYERFIVKSVIRHLGMRLLQKCADS